MAYFVFNQKEKKEIPITATKNMSVIVPHRQDVPAIKNYLSQIKDSQTEAGITWIFSEDGKASHYSDGANILFVQSNDSKGKKAAITHAMNFVKDAYVLTNDADIFIPSKDYFRRVQSEIIAQKSQLWIGLYEILPSGHYFLDALQLSENKILQMLTYSFTKIGKPILCSGANLAYEKAVFEKLKVYEGNLHILSGDDLFLLEAFSNQNDINIATSKHKDTIVKTSAKKDWAAYFSQRIRWAGKTKYLKNFNLHFVSLVTLLSHLFCTAGIAFALVYKQWHYLFPLILKSITELYVAYTGEMKLEKKFTFASVLFSQFYGLILIYMLIFGSLNKTRWKGRTL
jgi:poly-beta-1,6-N-acetyl-D-glucosamine synthase